MHFICIISRTVDTRLFFLASTGWRKGMHSDFVVLAIPHHLFSRPDPEKRVYGSRHQLSYQWLRRLSCWPVRQYGKGDCRKLGADIMTDRYLLSVENLAYQIVTFLLQDMITKEGDKMMRSTSPWRSIYEMQLAWKCQTTLRVFNFEKYLSAQIFSITNCLSNCVLRYDYLLGSFTRQWMAAASLKRCSLTQIEMFIFIICWRNFLSAMVWSIALLVNGLNRS